MAAGTTLDKIGPMCRDAQDCAIVLRAIAGPDNLDLAVPARRAGVVGSGERPLPEAHRHVSAMMEAENNPEPAPTTRARWRR